MCSCNLEALAMGGEEISANEIISNEANRKFLAVNKMISKEAFKQGDVLAVLQYLYCVSASKFKAVFAERGITISGEDLPTLAIAIKTKGDMAGQILNDNQQPVYFDAMEVVRKINYTKDEIAQASCQIILT